MKIRHDSIMLPGYFLASLEKGGECYLGHVRMEIKYTYFSIGIGIYGWAQFRAGVINVGDIGPG